MSEKLLKTFLAPTMWYHPQLLRHTGHWCSLSFLLQSIFQASKQIKISLRYENMVVVPEMLHCVTPDNV